MNIQRWIFGVMAFFVMMTAMTFPSVATAGDSLTDILREKGILTKEEWIRLNAAEEKPAAEMPTAKKDSGVKDPSVATAGDSLTDILREKGIISKEEWIRLNAAEEKPAAEMPTAKKDSEVKVGFGKKGFTLTTADGVFNTKIQWRFQGRYTFPERSDPRNADAFSDNEESTFELRRVRLKVGGHGYKPWIKYFLEVDWQPTISNASNSCCGDRTRLIDWRIMLEKFKWAKLRIGQWKINYSRERVDSSGKQTMVERSIMNRVFTLDRQVGMMLYGRVNPGTILDTNYYLGIYSGSGRATANPDDNMMYMGRIQWNMFGRELKWRQSDVTFHKKPTGSASFSAYTVKGKCTRWSSSGCGSIGSDSRAGDGFSTNVADSRYQVNGMQVGSAFKYRGFAWQHETHWKTIKDTEATAGLQNTNMFGGYLQAGYFPHGLISAVPKPLEIAFRYSHVDPNTDGGGDFRQELTTGFNWFFAGHRNKLTLDISHLTLEQERPSLPAYTEQRARLQWDVSF